MSKQLLIYERATPISPDKHRNLSVRSGTSWAFAAHLNSVPMLVTEIEPASAEMPIVFAGEGETLSPVALLGLRADENLFVNPDGGWTGAYIPAFLRRYPFVFAETGEDGQTLTLCIDEASDGVNTQGRGERLFDSEGERTHYLSRMLKFSSDYQAQHDLTRRFCQQLLAMNLLEPAVARVTLGSGQTLTVTGFQRVNRTRLNDLDDTEVTRLFRSETLALIYYHIASLGHVSQLATRTRPGKGDTPDASKQADAIAEETSLSRQSSMAESTGSGSA